MMAVLPGGRHEERDEPHHSCNSLYHKKTDLFPLPSSRSAILVRNSIRGLAVESFFPFTIGFSGSCSIQTQYRYRVR